MPVIKSAKKKLRQDKKRQTQNKEFKETLRLLVKKAKIAKTEKAVKEAVQAADKASKKRVIHANKAARIKSALSKLFSRTKQSEPKGKSSVKTKK